MSDYVISSSNVTSKELPKDTDRHVLPVPTGMLANSKFLELPDAEQELMVIGFDAICQSIVSDQDAVDLVHYQPIMPSLFRAIALHAGEAAVDILLRRLQAFGAVDLLSDHGLPIEVRLNPLAFKSGVTLYALNEKQKEFSRVVGSVVNPTPHFGGKTSSIHGQSNWPTKASCRLNIILRDFEPPSIHRIGRSIISTIF